MPLLTSKLSTTPLRSHPGICLCPLRGKTHPSVSKACTLTGNWGCRAPYTYIPPTPHPGRWALVTQVHADTRQVQGRARCQLEPQQHPGTQPVYTEGLPGAGPGRRQAMRSPCWSGHTPAGCRAKLTKVLGAAIILGVWARLSSAPARAWRTVDPQNVLPYG